MNRLSTIAFALALLASSLGATQEAPFASPAASPANTPSPDPAVTKRAQTLFAQLQAGKLDRSQLDDSAAADITDSKIKQAQSVVGPLGQPVTFEQQYVFTREGVTAYVYLLSFGNGTQLRFSMDVDGKGKIAGLLLLPAQ